MVTTVRDGDYLGIDDHEYRDDHEWRSRGAGLCGAKKEFSTNLLPTNLDDRQSQSQQENNFKLVLISDKSTCRSGHFQ